MRAKPIAIAPASKIPVSTTIIASCTPRRPVASLIRLSPPMIAVTRRGTRSRESTSWTATVSVGERIAPMRKHTAQGSSGISCLATTPTHRIVNATRPTARDRIGRSQRRKSCHEVSQASA